MVSRSNVLEAANVLWPAPLPRIKRSREHKTQVFATARRLKKQRIELRLAIGGIGAQIAERAAEIRARRDSRVGVGIDTAEQRPRKLHSVMPLQLCESSSAGE